MSALRKIIVLDSNLVISAFLNPRGTAAQVLGIWLEYFDLACSKETFIELVEVLKRDKFDKYLSQVERLERAEAYAQSALFFDVALEITDCRDPKDNKFLALAITAGARVIVSGDKRDLVSMHPYRGIDIVWLREFLEGYEKYRS